MPKKLITICLISLLTLLALLLLIGQRFNFTWAGGDGYNPNIPLVSQAGDLVRRGQTVSTAADEFLLLSNELIEIRLDQNTDLEIISMDKKTVELYVHRGRIIADTSNLGSDPVIHIRSDYVRTGFEAPGQISFVYYDFLNKVSVIPFENTTVSYQIADIYGNTSEPIDISELEPYEITPFDFQIQGSAAEDFYLYLMN